MAVSPPEKSGGNTRYDRKGCDVVSHDCASANDCAFADCDARQEHGRSTDISPSFYSNGSDLQVRLYYWPVGWQAGMDGTEDLGSRPPAHIILEHEIPSVKVRLRPNPYVVANPRGAVRE